MKVRDPYNIATWGWECGRGIRYSDLGPTIDGQKGAVRKLGSGHKKSRTAPAAQPQTTLSKETQ